MRDGHIKKRKEKDKNDKKEKKKKKEVKRKANGDTGGACVTGEERKKKFLFLFLSKIYGNWIIGFYWSKRQS